MLFDKHALNSKTSSLIFYQYSLSCRPEGKFLVFMGLLPATNENFFVQIVKEKQQIQLSSSKVRTQLTSSGFKIFSLSIKFKLQAISCLW